MGSEESSEEERAGVCWGGGGRDPGAGRDESAERKRKRETGRERGGGEAAEAEPSTSHQTPPLLSFYQLQAVSRTRVPAAARQKIDLHSEETPRRGENICRRVVARKADRSGYNFVQSRGEK